MKKSILFYSLLWCLALGFALTAMAQDKVEPDPTGRAPYTQVVQVPIIPTDDMTTVYPQSINYWTGTTDGATKTDTSEVRAYGGGEDGWMMFDITAIPDYALIQSIQFYGYVNFTYFPYWSATPLPGLNPLTATASELKTAIQANTAQGVAYIYSNESSTFAPGWHNYLCEPWTSADMQAALAQDWFAMGIGSRDASATYYTEWDGWAEANPPYLEVTYIVPTPGDVGTISIDVASVVGVGAMDPKATVFNYSDVPETFTVQMDINGYTSTKTVTALASLTSEQVTFDTWNATVGDYTIDVCTQLGGDPNTGNDCMSQPVSVQDLTPAYGYNAYDPTSTFVEGPVSLFLQTPAIMTQLAATTSSDFIACGTWDTYNQVWYGVQYSATGNSPVYTIDEVTGAMTLVGSTGLGEGLNGMAYDPITEQLYAVSAINLYTIDRSTGAGTLVAPCGTGTWIALACSPSGQLYGIDLADDNLYSIDKATGTITLIGYLGFDVIYAQGADFDHDTNVLWWGAWNSGLGVGEMYVVDVTTAATTYMGLLGPGIEMCALAIPAAYIPVELVSFSANVNETTVELSWTTASEINNHGFEIQRSSNGEFVTVGFVEGHGTTTEVQNYSYTDREIPEGSYGYRLKQVDLDGTFEYSDVVEVDVTVPDVFALEQNYPNPFNPSTKIDFSLAVDSKVSLKVFDVLGQEVATLINSDLVAGAHNVDFDASSLNSGVYFYRIEATGIDGTNFTNVKKMILTK